MNKHTITTITAIFILFISSYLHSRENFGPEIMIAEFGFAEEEVIIASKRAQTVSEAPAIVSIITEEQIKRMGAKTLADVLKIIPGIEIRYTVSGSYEMAVRGIYSPSDILVLIDGHRVNDFYDGTSPYDMSVTNVKRIEVIRGPGSALYGTNAFVGIVNIITLDECTGLNVSIKGGTFNINEKKLLSEINALRADTTNSKGKIPQLSELFYGADTKNSLMDAYQISVFGGKNWSKWNMVAFFEYVDTDGPKLLIKNDSEFKPNVKYPWSSAPGNTVDWKKKTNMCINIGHKKLRFNTKLFDESHGPNIGEYETLTPDTKIKSQIYLGDLSYKFSILHQINATAKIYGDRQHKDKYIYSYPPGYSVDTNKNGIYEVSRGEVFPEGKIKHIGYDATTYGADFQIDYKLPKTSLWTNNDIVAGSVIEWSKLSNFFFNTNYKGDVYLGPNLANYYSFVFKQNNKTRTVEAAYIQDSWYLTPKLNLSKSFEISSYIGLTSGIRYDHYSDFGASTTPRVGLVWQLVKYKPYGTSLIMKVLYGRAFRAPTFQNLYDVTGGSLRTPYLGYEKLKPETIKTIEVGTELKVKDIASIRGNIFKNEIKDKIEYIDTGGPESINTIKNWGGTRITGYETELKGFFKNENYCFLNYSSFNAIDTEGLPPDESGYVSQMMNDKLTYIPLRRANAGINISFKKHMNFNLSTVWVDSCRNNSRIVAEGLLHRFRSPGYTCSNMTLTAKNLYNRFSVIFSVYNLFNDNVVEPLVILGLDTNLPRPKRNFSLELNCKVW